MNAFPLKEKNERKKKSTKKKRVANIFINLARKGSFVFLLSLSWKVVCSDKSKIGFQVERHIFENKSCVY